MNDVINILILLLFTTKITRNGAIRTSSQIGENLLAQSRMLENEPDYSWIADYSIQFQSCLSVLQYGEGGGGGGEEGGAIRKQNLVKFRLCPADSCGKGCKGQYLTEMNRFVESYMEFKQEEQEQACENVENSCNCNDDAVDDRSCLNSCFESANLDYCVQNDDEESEDFDVGRMMECEPLGDQEDANNNYNYNTLTYYVGARCSRNRKSIYMDVFADSMCTKSAPSGTYEKYMYGNSLPYSKQSVVSRDCISCLDQGDDDNNDYIEINEMCEKTYEEAAKCDKGLNIAYPQTDECWFIKTGVERHAIGYTNKIHNAISFSLLCICFGLLFVVYLVNGKAKKKGINLSDWID